MDILQPCVTFNRVNTHQWFKDHTEPIPDTHDPADRMKALELAFRTDKLPVGIFYLTEDRPTFTETLPAYETSDEPLFARKVDREELGKAIEELK